MLRLFLVTLALLAPVAMAQEVDDAVANETPPDEATADDFSSAEGDRWSIWALAVGIIAGLVLAVVLWRRPRDRTPP